MLIPEGMLTLEGRLSSFVGARPLPKRRGSSTKGQKSVSWPHARPSPEQLAKAGFFYTPVALSPDNVTCFMCEKCLDGWEEDDDPALEHLHHSGHCAWATIACVEQADELSNYERKHPLSDHMTEARRATFADRWPHEKKKGWTCKTEKMLEAGWYYCPTDSSDDFVACPYCNLAVDGWEPKDKPLDEHRRRSPTCLFIELSAKQKRTTKRGRTSKASRTSALSVASVASDLAAPNMESVQDEDSGMTAATDASMKPKAGKKSARGKKATGRATSKKAQAKVVEDVEMSGTMEPEDSGFEVKVDQPVKPTRGRKRKSAELTASDVGPEGQDEPTASSAPAAKRRATHTRGSTAQQAEEPPSSPGTAGRDTVDLITPESELKAASKKKSRKAGNRKPLTSTRRASQRKASVRSTASKASLRVPELDDDEIEKALEKDLDRPLGGDEVVAAPTDVEMTDAEQISTEVAVPEPTTSVAPVRRSSRNQSARSSTQSQDKERDPPTIALESARPSLARPTSSSSGVVQPAAAASEATTAKAKAVRKAPGKQQVAIHEQTGDDVQAPTKAITRSTPSLSPQSSDAENHPPSSRRTILSSLRSARLYHVPELGMQTRTPRPLSPSKRDNMVITKSDGRGLETTMPWSAVDLDAAFGPVTPMPAFDEDGDDKPLKRRRINTDHDHDDNDDDKENNDNDKETPLLLTTALDETMDRIKAHLTSPEKKMSVEQWLRYTAKVGEERLRRECERMVCTFEREGNRALRALEGIVALETV